jgi:hypothetical protein
LIDGTAIGEGDDTLWAWLLESAVSEDQARAIERRFDGQHHVREARAVARELCAAVS